MRTEIDPTLTQLSSDLSQDMVTIHYRDGSEGRSVTVGSSTGDTAELVFGASSNTAEVFLEIREQEYLCGPGEEDGDWFTTSRRIQLVDVYDVEVDSYGNEPPYFSQPFLPFARWLRSKTGKLVRLDLNL